MEPIKISQETGGLNKIIFNNTELNAVYFNKTLIWPATYTPTVDPYSDESTDLDYDPFEELL